MLPPRNAQVFRGRLVGGGVPDFSKWTIDAATGASDGVLGASVPAVFAPGNAERRYPVVVLASAPLDGPPLEIPVPEHWAAVGTFRARLRFASGEPARPAGILRLPLMGGGYLSRSVTQLSVDPATAIVTEAGLPPGDYRLLVDSGGSYVHEDVAEFTLQPSQAVDLGDLVVPGPGWLRAELRLDGAPFDGPFERIVIQRASPSGAWHPLATFRDRMPEQVKLPVGEHRFESHARGRVPSAEFAFRIDSERTTQLDVDLRSKREQRVRVLPKAGAVPPDALTLRSRLVRLGDDAVARPWTELEFARVGAAWERVLTVDVGTYELEVDAGEAGHAKLEHDCHGVLPGVLTLQLE